MILDYLNRPKINIKTVEDQFEICVQGINQNNIDAKVAFVSSIKII